MSQISQIAYQCPLKSASAVYKARSLYSIIHPFTDFDNRAICLGQGINYRVANNQDNSKLEITQNANILNVTYSGIGNLQRLKLINVLGQELFAWQTNQKQEQINLNSLHLQNGIYILQAVSEDGKTTTKKFNYRK
jgi:hypothetical protein